MNIKDKVHAKMPGARWTWQEYNYIWIASMQSCKQEFASGLSAYNKDYKLEHSGEN